MGRGGDRVIECEITSSPFHLFTSSLHLSITPSLHLTPMHYLSLIPYAIAGTLLASTLALVPALHVYNIAGIFFLFALRAQNVLGDEALAMFFSGDDCGLCDAQYHLGDFSRRAR